MFYNSYNNCHCGQTYNTGLQNNCGQYYNCQCRCYAQTNRNCGRWVYVPVYQRIMAWVYVGGSNQTFGGSCQQNTFEQTSNRCSSSGDLYYARQYGLY